MKSDDNGKIDNVVPPITINGQYIKDLSFENPGQGYSLQNKVFSPEIDVDVNVDVQEVTEGNYEVILSTKINAKQDKKNIYILELQYAGGFTLSGLPSDVIDPVLLIECPRLLFPFVRQIIADVTMNGGFPPVCLDPIDFAGIYQQQNFKKSDTSH